MHFTFKARKPDGEIYVGTQDAKDRYEIYRMLHDAGDELISYTDSPAISIKKIFAVNVSFGVKMHDKIIFARSLASMLEAGLPLSHALVVLERQTKAPTLKKVIGKLIKSISTGQMFSRSLAEHPKIFPPIFVSMVKAGEESGTLAASLKSVTAQMESTYNLNRKVRGAMMYPTIIMGVMGLIGILMMVYVVPTLTKTFSELKISLPASTRLIIWVSNLIRYDGIVLLILALLMAGMLYFFARRPSGKKLIHFALLKMPIAGEIIREVNIARTARTLSSLVGSGVDIVESINITKDVLQNVYYKKVLMGAERIVNSGEPLSKVFTSQPKLYPVFFGEMISVGEETGKIAEMLGNVATFYEDDVTEKTKDMSTVIEPLLMVVIGVGVGFFAMAMITPMYSLSSVI
jgi:type IV pilus assembly protein PilC